MRPTAEEQGHVCAALIEALSPGLLPDEIDVLLADEHDRRAELRATTAIEGDSHARTEDDR
jgi:hypothetical protein